MMTLLLIALALAAMTASHLANPVNVSASDLEPEYDYR